MSFLWAPLVSKIQPNGTNASVIWKDSSLFLKFLMKKNVIFLYFKTDKALEN